MREVSSLGNLREFFKPPLDMHLCCHEQFELKKSLLFVDMFIQLAIVFIFVIGFGVLSEVTSLGIILVALGTHLEGPCILS